MYSLYGINFYDITLTNLFTSIWIIAGLYMDFKLLWMVIYEIKYGKGEEYFSNGNKGIKK